MKIQNEWGKRMVFFDGGTGTLLQQKGLGPGELPEKWNILYPDVIKGLHKDYLAAGCDIVKTNTFGANGLKFGAEGEFSLEKVVSKAVALAKEAVKEAGRGFVALDIGPTGKLLKPLGDLSFEAAYGLFQEVVKIGVKAGAELILIETMNDTYELKAAVLAAKENSSLPVFATMIFDEKGKMLTGADVYAAVSLLEGLGVDALGINCGLGPKQMEPIAKKIMEISSTPVIVNPNAGLPRSENGKTVFDVGPEEFASYMKEIQKLGPWILGGCCGTTPEHMKKVVECCKDAVPLKLTKKERTWVSSYAKAVEIGPKPVIIGERINPTGKPKLKQALREKDFDYLLREGITQQQKGAHILDVNVGLPEIDEPSVMERAIEEIQSVIDLPLQIDTSNFEAMERAMRVYNGKPLVNSVNGKEEVMEKVFPLVKKYGGVVVALTLDEAGIPPKARDRVQIAQRIYENAAKYGIEKKDILMDTLALTISSEKEAAKETIKAVKGIKKELGGKTILGVSNISFGLPQRENINAAFFALALGAGLSAAIMNPSSESMRKVYDSFLALWGLDESCGEYILKYSNQENQTVSEKEKISLFDSVVRGLKDSAKEAAKASLLKKEPLMVIQDELIPALDKVGKGFEKGEVFLPQLLMSAEAAKASFEVVKDKLLQAGQKQEKKGKVILATVEGDIHDIGKNIVKVLLENYNFDVIDLGKDVPAETVVEKAKEEEVHLIGLSALMTTTVTSMEKTIKLLRQSGVDCKVMVGGAVLTEEYASMIGADYYAKDAMASVYYAQKILEG